ncbi:MAG TPA: SDR family NAD(P)-dependent oxidoreductase [Anaerolineaceae bacterium]
MTLLEKTILITGGARRVGRQLAIAAARAGADVVLHHSASQAEAEETAAQIEGLGRKAWIVQADFNQPAEAEGFIERATAISPLYAIVNSAAIFAPLSLQKTTLADWQRHMNINLTAPFLLSRDFAAQVPAGGKGRIVNILDWRALRPVGDHFAYTISKAALAAMTQALAAALAPNIIVNGLALGAILPPSDGSPTDWVERVVPARRWARLDELGDALLFLLDGPEYITGEILHLDGGRHLV